RITYSTNGWTDKVTARTWIEGFEEQTHQMAAGRTRFIFLDGHSSHYALPVLQFAKEHNIELLGYPPHCTHALQGLDVVCFAKFKLAWRAELSRYHELYQQKVKKEDITGLFGNAYLAAFTEETVKAAFSATGIVPFNPD
ncbi:hypothetical protein PUNSTDRAFT_16929, partial [Punctularia strigosozonata HHB-11173 SS5]|uniref:uncharacterized protein n=1 Tax=Punctularia strigosozonata (strain HHB-11173) TaxID=741275 RepID=UPI00044178C7